jgi:hypothetical protein
MKIVNGIISDVSLMIEDHGCLTIFLHIEMEFGTQGFGGFSLGGFPKDRHNYAGIWIRRIFEMVDVTDWKNIKGKPVRVMYRDDKKVNQPIAAIGHIIKDKWFDPESEFNKLKEDEEIEKELSKIS